MSLYDDNLQQWHIECQNKIAEAKAIADSTVEADVEQFQRNTLDNIQQQFGDFLYIALGDRVTGQRSSILNTKFFEETQKGKEIVIEATTKGITVEELLTIKQKEVNSMDYYNARFSDIKQVQLYITAGRKFGVSYFTGEGDRVHTMYFGAAQAFTYLTFLILEIRVLNPVIPYLTVHIL